MKQRQRGATLPQFITCLALVATLAAVGVASLRKSLPNYRLTRAARSLVVHIQRAKLQAVQRGSVYYLDFDLDGDGSLKSGGCILWEDRNDNHKREGREWCATAFDLAATPGVQFQAYPARLGGPKRGPNNTSVNAGGADGLTFSQNRIKFNPDATCSTGTIYLHNSRGRTLAIRLRYNGLVQMWCHDGGGWQRW